MKLIMQPKTYRKLMGYCRASRFELSGYGSVVRTADDTFLVLDVYLLSDTDSAGETNITEEQQAKFLGWYVEKGGNPERIRLWWHSHHSMSAFWSPTDVHAARNTPIGQTFDMIPWAVSIVVTHSGEYKARYDDKENTKDVTLHVEWPPEMGGTELEAECQKEVTARKMKPVVHAPMVTITKADDKKEPSLGNDVISQYVQYALLEGWSYVGTKEPEKEPPDLETIECKMYGYKVDINDDCPMCPLAGGCEQYYQQLLVIEEQEEKERAEQQKRLAGLYQAARPHQPKPSTGQNKRRRRRRHRKLGDAGADQDGGAKRLRVRL